MFKYILTGFMVDFMEQIYNDRRLFFGGGPAIVPNDNFGTVSSSSPSADRRSGRGRGMFVVTTLDH